MAAIVPLSSGATPSPLPQYVLARVVNDSTAENIAVPAKARYVRLSTDAAAWINAQGAAAKPSSDVTDGSASWLLPASHAEWFACDGVANISVIADDTGATVSAAFYC